MATGRTPDERDPFAFGSIAAIAANTRDSFVQSQPKTIVKQVEVVSGEPQPSRRRLYQHHRSSRLLQRVFCVVLLIDERISRL
jgi:hypothetical protein